MVLHQAAREAWEGRDHRPAFTFLVNGTAVVRSYAQQLTCLQSFAAELIRRGITPGDLVVIMMRHSPQLADAFLGALWMGAIPAFMPPPSDRQDPAYFWSSHAELFRRFGVRLLITNFLSETGQPERLLALNVPVWDAADAPPTGPVTVPLFSRGLDSIAFLQCSSGTTLTRKGVMLTNRAVLNQVVAYRQATGLGPDSTVASWLPLYHDMGLIASFLQPFLTGAHAVFMCPFEWIKQPLLLLDAIESSNADFVWMPNFAFNLLAGVKPPGRDWSLGGVTSFINCSEPCKADTVDRFVEVFSSSGIRPSQLRVCYAMAETVFAVSQTDPHSRCRCLHADREQLLTHRRFVPASDGSTITLLSAGTLIAGAEICVLNSEDESLPEGSVGEIAVAGTSLFSGYWCAGENSRSSFRGKWHLTGDLGFLLDGEVYITGRRQDLLIVRGQNFHAFDIEHLAACVPGIKAGRCVALGVPNPSEGSDNIVLIAELEQDLPAASLAVLRRSVRQAVFDQLGLMLTEVNFVPHGWIVKTTSGKMSRHLNLNKYQAELAAVV